MNALLSEGVNAKYFPSFEAVEDYILVDALPGDLVITMGAGDVTDISRSLLARLNKAE